MSIRKPLLTENYILGNVNISCGRKTFISLVRTRVSQKNTFLRSKIKFMSSIGSQEKENRCCWGLLHIVVLPSILSSTINSLHKVLIGTCALVTLKTELTIV